MGATDELRRMLDERGVEWSAPDSRLHDVKTRWAANGFDYTALEDPSGKAIDLIADYQESPITPEQAIEATLGRGTCHDVGKGWMWRCSECRCRLDIDRDDLPTMWVDGMASVPRYCPNCGRRVMA